MEATRYGSGSLQWARGDIQESALRGRVSSGVLRWGFALEYIAAQTWWGASHA